MIPDGRAGGLWPCRTSPDGGYGRGFLRMNEGWKRGARRPAAAIGRPRANNLVRRCGSRGLCRIDLQSAMAYSDRPCGLVVALILCYYVANVWMTNSERGRPSRLARADGPVGWASEL